MSTPQLRAVFAAGCSGRVLRGAMPEVHAILNAMLSHVDIVQYT